jgi:hypothetical protein
MLKLAPLFPLRLRGRAEELEDSDPGSPPLSLKGRAGRGSVK